MTDAAALIVEPLRSHDISAFPLFAGLEESYGIVQAFSKDAAIDAAYSAIHAVISAATYFARDMSDSTEHRIIYVPTIVLDGELFRCGLSEGGDVSVRPTDMASLIYDNTETPRVNATCVHIIRESALKKFIDRAATTFDSLRATLKLRRNESKAD